MSTITTVGKLIADMVGNFDLSDSVMVQVGASLPVEADLASAEIETLNGTKRLVLIRVKPIGGAPCAS